MPDLNETVVEVETTPEIPIKKVNTIASLTFLIKDLLDIVQTANSNNTGLVLDIENLRQRLG